MSKKIEHDVPVKIGDPCHACIKHQSIIKYRDVVFCKNCFDKKKDIKANILHDISHKSPATEYNLLTIDQKIFISGLIEMTVLNKLLSNRKNMDCGSFLQELISLIVEYYITYLDDYDKLQDIFINNNVRSHIQDRYINALRGIMIKIMKLEMDIQTIITHNTDEKYKKTIDHAIMLKEVLNSSLIKNKFCTKDDIIKSIEIRYAWDKERKDIFMKYIKMDKLCSFCKKIHCIRICRKCNHVYSCHITRCIHQFNNHEDTCQNEN